MLKTVLRCSAACAFYTPFADRPNFTIITNANVTRIIWSENENSSSLSATGVEYVANNETVILDVAGEVILSAGTIGSPKILELSGVGNSTILRAAGVEPLLDLPTVGENLADHVHSWANAFAVDPILTKDILLRDPEFADQQLQLWHENRTGKL
ncbi:hypothetical protein MPER_08179 [Moniliophthora perniciosa FA553]|nr:hypothetical protein MPER_08179 [Moniliophthora perniciosa FA553]